MLGALLLTVALVAHGGIIGGLTLTAWATSTDLPIWLRVLWAGFWLAYGSVGFFAVLGSL